jgi:hypothetical protein
MLILNFTHPLTSEQCATIEQLAGDSVEEVRAISVQINQSEPLTEQVVIFVNAAHLSADEWQTRHLLNNPPGYAPAAFVLLAELHGRIGHFPSVIRLRPQHDPLAGYEVAELLNLQAIRDAARKRRC